MKKIEKGVPGYLDYKKKIEIIRTVIYFGIVAAIFFLGYLAVLGCLPASKALVGVIARMPYKSVDRGLAADVASKTTHLTVCYDMVITSTEKIMPVDCIVISGHNVFGYTHSEKVDTEELSKHIKKILEDNRFTGLTVKVLNKYKAFIARAEGLDYIAAVEREDSKEREEAIRGIILNISL